MCYDTVRDWRPQPLDYLHEIGFKIFKLRNTASHLPTTTAWIFKISQANKHLWPLSMVQIKAFLGVSTFLVGKFWGYSHIKLTIFKTCLWTCNMCHMGPEHTRL